MVNPYATPPPNPGTAPNPALGLFNGNARYAVKDVPESTDPEYTTGYSPVLVPGGSSTGAALPDNVRIGRRRPPVEGGTYNRPDWVAKRTAEQNKRYEADHLDTMWSVRQQRIPPPRVPLWEQERAPTRPTATNSPTGYAFQREWLLPRNAATVWNDNDPKADTGASRMHFSLADHRRKYEILTMKPQGRVGTNTYQIGRAHV